MASDGVAPDERLAQIRALILGAEQARLESIEKRLEDPVARIEDVSRVLAEAIATRARRDRSIQVALQPVLEDVLRISVMKNPKMLADALYPVIGEAVRKSVARSLRGLVESLNQIIERSFSLQSLRWRWESLTTGKPFGEIVLLRSLSYRVEQVFLIHRESGLLLQHFARDIQGIQDKDMVSGMLTAIQDFVHDSFGTTANEELETMQSGELTVWVFHGPLALLAAVISGSPPPELRRRLQVALEKIHQTYGPAMAAFRGDTAALAGTLPILENCVPSQNATRPRKQYAWLWVPAILLFILIAFAWFTIRANQRWSAYVARVRSEPGILVTSAETRGGRYVLYGLRDPLATDPARLSDGFGIERSRVEARMQPYLSLDPEFVKRREALALKGLIEEQMVHFLVNSAQISPGQLTLIDTVESAVRKMIQRGLNPRIKLTGHADQTGQESKNASLSIERAEAVRRVMTARGLPESIFAVEGVGAKQPFRTAFDADTNRRVEFRVTLPDVVK